MSFSSFLKKGFLSLLVFGMAQSTSCMDHTPKKNLDEQVATVLASKPIDYFSKITAVGGGALWFFTADNPDNVVYNVGVVFSNWSWHNTPFCSIRYAENFLENKKKQKK